MNCPKCQALLSASARFCERCGAMLNEAGDAADPLIGRVLLDRYRVLSAIGQGGMGSVYLAEQRMGQATRKVAIKALRREHTRDAQLSGRFHRESAIVIQLGHPNIIQFHDFGELGDGTLIIVMEYIEGGTLQALLKRSGPLPLTRVEHLLAQIAGALDEAHRHGVVHRDLKPQNILVTTRGGDADFVKVVDFGIAMQNQADHPEQDTRLTSQGTVIGTPAYMSPEQFRGEEPDPRADVYSLAVISYEMLTGKLPLQARTPWEWASQHLNAEPESLDVHAAALSLPEHVCAAVMRGLKKDREQRFPDARAFLYALRGQPDAQTLAPTRVMPRTAHASAAPQVSALTAPEPPDALEDSDSQVLPLAQTAPAPISHVASPPKQARGRGWWIAAGAASLLLIALARTTLQPTSDRQPRPPSATAAPAPKEAGLARTPRAQSADLQPPLPAANSDTPQTEAASEAAETDAVPEEAAAEAPPPSPVAPAADEAADPNQALAREGLSALQDGRLDFALTALETAETALGSTDPTVVELRSGLRARGAAWVTQLAETDRCDEAKQALRRLGSLGLRPTSDPLSAPSPCAEADSNGP